MSTLLEKLLRIAEVECATGLDRSSIYRKINADPPTFPEPVAIGARAVAWRESELSEWIEAQATQGRAAWRANRPKAQAAAKHRRTAEQIKPANADPKRGRHE